jgi:hypothetical protein
LRRTRHRRGGTTLFSSMAWGPHKTRLWGSPDLKDIWRSHPSDLATRLDHPLHLHMMRGVPMGLSSWRRRRRRRSSLALREACSECRLRWPSSPHIGFSYGTPRLDAILQRSVGKHPQGIRLGNSWPWCITLMKECWVSHSVWREPFAPRGHPQTRERREIFRGRSTTSKEAPTSGEEGRHRRKGNRDQRCYV